MGPASAYASPRERTRCTTSQVCTRTPFVASRSRSRSRSTPYLLWSGSVSVRVRFLHPPTYLPKLPKCALKTLSTHQTTHKPQSIFHVFMCIKSCFYREILCTYLCMFKPRLTMNSYLHIYANVCVCATSQSQARQVCLLACAQAASAKFTCHGTDHGDECRSHEECTNKLEKQKQQHQERTKTTKTTKTTRTTRSAKPFRPILSVPFVQKKFDCSQLFPPHHTEVL